MDHRVPRIGVRVTLLLAAAAFLTFVFLNSRFEGPGDPIKAISGGPQLTVTFTNTKKLPTKQPVLFKGYGVGRVNKVEWLPGRTAGRVTFTLDDDFALHEDAVVRIGERSLLGDPFLDVVTRGSKRRPELGDGDEVVNARTSVNFDEALDFLDADGRRDVQSLLRTVARGVPSHVEDAELNGTVGGLTHTISQAHELTRQVRGQEEQIAGLVSGAGKVLDELGRREDSVRTIVSSGRTTLDALAADTRSLERGVEELPRLLGAARRSLDGARPLVAELREPVRKLRVLAPDLTRALDPEARYSLRSIAVDLDAILDAIPPLRRAAVPILRDDVLPLVKLLQPLVREIQPAARSLVPALEYLASGEPGTSRAEAIAGLYASIGASNKGKNGTRGAYSRAGFTFDPAEYADRPADDCPNSGYCRNAYPKSGDGLDPQPFGGEYPRITECRVPPRSRPTEDCR